MFILFQVMKMFFNGFNFSFSKNPAINGYKFIHTSSRAHIKVHILTWFVVQNYENNIKSGHSELLNSSILKSV